MWSTELMCSSIVIGYWPNHVPIGVWITIMLVVIVALNLMPVGIYAEAEFWFAGIKLVMLLGLLILAFIIVLGGGPDHDRLGFRYWVHPGATKAYLIGGAGGQFTAFLYVWVFAGFSFYFGPELIIFTTGEMHRPRKNLPTAARRYFYRLVFFYVLGALAIGTICSSDVVELTSGGGANASPWVIAIKNAGISVLPAIINAGVLTSAWSAGNSFLYMSSRSLYSMAVVGNAPKIFARCTRHGLPIYAVAASSCFALLAYLNLSSGTGKVFNWFISLTNTAGYTSWIVCCITYLRFHSTVRRICLYRALLVPAAYQRLHGLLLWSICLSSFLTTYLGIPIFILLWLGHKAFLGRHDAWMVNPAEMDLVSKLREVEDDEQAFAEMDAMRTNQGHASGAFRRTLSWISPLWE
nr:proline-specific permease [Quercus suber]